MDAHFKMASKTLGWLSQKAKQAISFNPNKNNTLNPAQLQRYNRNPMLNPNINPEAVDENNNGVADMLEQNSGMIVNGPFKFKKNISVDKHGNYVPTLSYPLPPVSHDKQKFKENYKRRNENNKFL